jgi:hypothetical protein
MSITIFMLLELWALAGWTGHAEHDLSSICFANVAEL